jgi:MFS family permease
VQHPASQVVHPAPAAPDSAAAPRRAPVGTFYVVEGITTSGVAQMLSSIYFYTTGHFGWGSAQNFLLAAVLGVVYVFGALAAHAVSSRLGRRRTLVASYVVMAALALVSLSAGSPRLLVAALLLYSGVSAITWPALESLVASGAAPGEMARRLGLYNCVWSGVGAVTLALAGTILEYWPAGIFVLPAVAHGGAALLLWSVRRRGDVTADKGPPGPHATPPGATGDAEPALLRVRTLALWMSRLALPATFVVISSLLAAMPTLPLIRRLYPAAGTAVASVWMAARWLAFLSLGATSWWHTRPKALLWAAIVLLVAFVAITFRGDWLPGAPQWATRPWVTWIVAWQALLGLALGLIYSASLYFGMVLSDGSTEHGGYHEALIGLGTVIGPGAGALAERMGGGDPRWGVVAVASVLGASIIACAVVASRRPVTR